MSSGFWLAANLVFVVHKWVILSCAVQLKISFVSMHHFLASYTFLDCVADVLIRLPSPIMVVMYWSVCSSVCLFVCLWRGLRKKYPINRFSYQILYDCGLGEESMQLKMAEWQPFLISVKMYWIGTTGTVGREQYRVALSDEYFWQYFSSTFARWRLRCWCRRRNALYTEFFLYIAYSS